MKLFPSHTLVVVDVVPRFMTINWNTHLELN